MSSGQFQAFSFEMPFSLAYAPKLITFGRRLYSWILSASDLKIHFGKSRTGQTSSASQAAYHTPPSPLGEGGTAFSLASTAESALPGLIFESSGLMSLT